MGRMKYKVSPNYNKHASALAVSPHGCGRWSRPVGDSVPIHRLRADADTTAAPHHRWLCEECRIESIIPATRGHRPHLTGFYRRRMQRYSPPPAHVWAALDSRDGLFGRQAQVRRGAHRPASLAAGQASLPAWGHLQPLPHRPVGSVVVAMADASSPHGRSNVAFRQSSLVLITYY